MTTGTTTESILARIAVDSAWISGVGVGGRTGLNVGADHRLGDPPVPGGGEDFRRLGRRQGRDFDGFCGHISSPVESLRKSVSSFPKMG